MSFSSADASHFPQIEHGDLKFRMPPKELRHAPLYSQVDDIDSLAQWGKLGEKEQQGIAILQMLHTVRRSRELFSQAQDSRRSVPEA